MLDLFPSLIGGSLGLALGALYGFYRFAGHFASFRAKLEEAAKRPLSADWTAIVQEAATLEEEGRSLLGIVKRVFGK